VCKHRIGDEQTLWVIHDLTSVSGFLLHLLVAAVLGYAIGFERQWTRHQAGTVTCMMVVVGSFAFTAFGFLLTVPSNTDLTRIPGQIVTGIGFLGAGVILKEGGTIKGLTTAATVWACSAIGILCCLDNVFYAFACSMALVFLHLCFHPLSVWIEKNRRYKKTRYDKLEKMYKISVICRDDQASEVKDGIMQIITAEPNALLHDMETVDMEGDQKKIRAFITTKQNNDALIEKMLSEVGAHDEIIRAGWKVVEDND